jgi:magnesium transporter
MPQTIVDRTSPSDGRLPDATPPAAPPAPTVRITIWRPGGLTESSDHADLARVAGLVADPEARFWIDCVDPSPEVVRTIATGLGLHPLIAEDISERNQRSKIETFDDVVHIVMFALVYRGEVQTCEIDAVLEPHFLLTIHGPEWDPTSAGTLRIGLEEVLKRGVDYLLYGLADSIVDGYFPVLDALAEEIDQLQDDVVASTTDWSLQRLFTLKRELLAIRRATSPAREIFNQLTNREVGAVDKDHVVYFRDVYDHLIRVTDELDNYRDLVSGTLDIYVSIVNNDLSRIMKRLTGVTVILAGIGAVAGIFGMSEAGAAFAGGEAGGFWLVTMFVVIVAVGAAVFLRKIDWI